MPQIVTSKIPQANDFQHFLDIRTFEASLSYSSYRHAQGLLSSVNLLDPAEFE